jgi:hypothetical protein
VRVYGKRSFSTYWNLTTRETSGGKVEILLIRIFNKGGKLDARKKKVIFKLKKNVTA